MINQVIAGMVFRNAPQAYSGASSSESMSQKMSQIADKIDKNNTGTVTKEQFTAALQAMPIPIRFKAMGADALFDKIDPDKKGSVSKQDFAARMKDVMLQTRFQGASQSGSSPAAGQAQNTSAALASSLRSPEATAGRQAAASSYGQGTGSSINVYA